MKLEVKYKGVVIGHTFDGKIIEFLDNDIAKEVKDYMISGQQVGISSRRYGTINDDVLDYSIIKKQ